MTTIKYVDIKTYIKERNRLLKLARNRTLNFKDNNKNYYWYRLKELDLRHPDFSNVGIISLKG